MSDIKIQMKNVSKIFETDEMETLALSNIDLTIDSGSFISISGPSGCGKSTLLSLLGLLDEATSGEYFIEGIDVSHLTLDEAAEVRNKKIGFVFQSFNLIDELSVFDNIALPLRYDTRKWSNQAIQLRVNECLEMVAMLHRKNHQPNQLSGGQQQRIAIARAVVANPAILLVDEPTGNLDSKAGDKVMDLLIDLNKNGSTICMVTHDPRYADLANTQMKLLDGCFLRSGMSDFATQQQEQQQSQQKQR